MDESLLFLGAGAGAEAGVKKTRSRSKREWFRNSDHHYLEEFWLIAEGSLEYLFAEGGLPS